MVLLEQHREIALDRLKADCLVLEHIVKGRGYRRVEVHYRISTVTVDNWVAVDASGPGMKFFQGADAFGKAEAWCRSLPLAATSENCSAWFELDPAGVPT